MKRSALPAARDHLTELAAKIERGDIDIPSSLFPRGNHTDDISPLFFQSVEGVRVHFTRGWRGYFRVEIDDFETALCTPMPIRPTH